MAFRALSAPPQGVLVVHELTPCVPLAVVPLCESFGLKGQNKQRAEYRPCNSYRDEFYRCLHTEVISRFPMYETAQGRRHKAENRGTIMWSEAGFSEQCPAPHCAEEPEETAFGRQARRRRKTKPTNPAPMMPAKATADGSGTTAAFT